MQAFIVKSIHLALRILVTVWMFLVDAITIIKNDWKQILLLGTVVFAVKCTAFKPISTVEDVKVEESTSETISSEHFTIRDEVLNFAQKYKGAAYKYGGTTPKGFDCSGFTFFVMNEFDVKLPHNSAAQSKIGKKIPTDKAQRGDLLFFENKGKVNHVGMVYSNDKDGLYMIHSSSKRGIVIDNVTTSSYWKPRLKFARSILD